MKAILVAACLCLPDGSVLVLRDGTCAREDDVPFVCRTVMEEGEPRRRCVEPRPCEAVERKRDAVSPTPSGTGSRPPAGQ
jgi:hypothetical protein